jgi:hypothetical protein
MKSRVPFQDSEIEARDKRARAATLLVRLPPISIPQERRRKFEAQTVEDGTQRTHREWLRKLQGYGASTRGTDAESLMSIYKGAVEDRNKLDT